MRNIFKILIIAGLILILTFGAYEIYYNGFYAGVDYTINWTKNNLDLVCGVEQNKELLNILEEQQ